MDALWGNRSVGSEADTAAAPPASGGRGHGPCAGRGRCGWRVGPRGWRDGPVMLVKQHFRVFVIAGTGYGVLGMAAANAGVFGMSGSGGPTSTPTAGVVGTSDQHRGVIGTSNAHQGVYGFSSQNAGVAGESGSAQSFGGYFFGNVHMTGTLTSDRVKGAVMPFPDGTMRLLICMESPEPWFEDFGAGKLKRGRAVVRIDRDFAKVIKRGDYHVFLTPRGDCGGLYVRSQGGASFEVRELAGGRSSVAFSYRIVGRRKDVKRYRRFADRVGRSVLIPHRRNSNWRSRASARCR